MPTAKIPTGVATGAVPIPRPSPTALTRCQVIELLKAKRGARTLEPIAAGIGVTFQYLGHVINGGTRTPGERVLRWLGLREVKGVWYERD